MIDSTLLKPTATKDDIAKLCREAKRHGFGCVCINSMYVSLATQLLKGTDVKVCSTIGFPFGSTLPEVKAFEARRAVENLMRQTVGSDMGVKAAGGIRTLKDALAMIEAGANRIGTSTAVAIIEEFPE